MVAAIGGQQRLRLALCFFVLLKKKKKRRRRREKKQREVGGSYWSDSGVDSFRLVLASRMAAANSSPSAQTL